MGKSSHMLRHRQTLMDWLRIQIIMAGCVFCFVSSAFCLLSVACGTESKMKTKVTSWQPLCFNKSAMSDRQKTKLHCYRPSSYLSRSLAHSLLYFISLSICLSVSPLLIMSPLSAPWVDSAGFCFTPGPDNNLYNSSCTKKTQLNAIIS